MKDKRTLVIDVATKLFAEKGFESTPLSEICEKANVSKGLIFHHFKSKNDLLREIFSRTTGRMVEMNATDEKVVDPHEQLRQLLEAFFKELAADKKTFQLNISTMLQPKTRAVINDLLNERSSFILQSVRAIFDTLDPENAHVKSYMFVAELDGIALNYLCIFDEYPLEEIKAHLIGKYTEL